jgi:hypothetical protein
LNVPSPIEIDPRPCEHCGLTIDRHNMVDDGDGPEFFCRDGDDIVRRWELADPRDSWRHTGEKPPLAHVRNSDVGAKPARPEPYRTAQSTIDAFWHVVRNHDDVYLAAWLKRHPADAAFLIRLWEAKNARKS